MSSRLIFILGNYKSGSTSAQKMAARFRFQRARPACELVGFEPAGSAGDEAQPALRSRLTKEEYCRHFFEFISARLQPHQYLLDDILRRTSFKALTGRNAGEEARERFIRKGVSGDWQNHFTAEHKKIFKELAGDLLVKLGYEKHHNW